MLYGYLKYEIQPQISDVRNPSYRVYKMGGSNDVYLYEEKKSGTKVIGKFFESQLERNPSVAYRRLCREHHHLNMVRNIGFAGDYHYVPRTLGYNPGLHHLLVTEYCYGELLDRVIRRAIDDRDEGLLFYKLTSLAYFLSELHNRTADQNWKVDFRENTDYMNTIISSLQYGGILRSADELYYLRDLWYAQPKMWEDASVLVHGDATPANFMFGDSLHVVALDLERMHRTDRLFDTGRIVGELAHFFLMKTGSRERAEPFVGHFLWEYSCHFPDREQAFYSMNRRIPFYMGLNLLRIARNAWLDYPYRKRLVHEAKKCLREVFL